MENIQRTLIIGIIVISICILGSAFLPQVYYIDPTSIENMSVSITETDPYWTGNASLGANGTFTTADAKTVTVQNGLITSIT